MIRVAHESTPQPGYWIVRDDAGRRYIVKTSQVSASNRSFWCHRDIMQQVTP